MISLKLSCPGPEGSARCPGESETWAARQVVDSHDALKAAYRDILKDAEKHGWKRSKDNRLRCPRCAEAGANHPAEIAGIAWERWQRALELVTAGRPPSEWSGQDGLPTARQFNNAINRYPALREAWERAPLFKGPRKAYATGLSEERWAEVLARFEGGETKDAICVGHGWPTKKQWNGRMGRDAEFRRRVNAEHTRRGATEAMYDRAIEHVKAGGAVATLPGSPDTCTYAQFWRRLSEDQVFGERYRQAREIAGQTHIWVVSHEGKRIRFDGLVDWQGVIDALRKGAFVRDVIAPVRIGRYPYARQWYYRIKTDKEFAAEARRAYEDGWWVRPRLKYDRVIPSASYEKCLELVVNGLNPKEASKLAGIPVAAFRRKCKTDDAYGRRARLALHRQRANVPVGTVFRQRLSGNEIYAAVNAAVGRGFPPHMRDDIISSMVLDVLEGKLEVKECRARVKSYVTRYRRETEEYVTVSYDKPVGSGDGRMIDIMSADRALWAEHGGFDGGEVEGAHWSGGA